MCRWLAYSGAPIYLETLIFEPEHSLIDQSLSAHSGETTNGDGFGIGWYGSREVPGVFRDVQPAWNDANLRDLATQIESRLFLAHVRAATPGLTVQQTNCHPFRWHRWLLVHNGSIRGFQRLRRELLMQVDEELFPCLLGTTDSELILYLALTLGLESDVPGAVERTVGLVEAIGRRRGVDHPIQMTLGIANGESLWAFRYSSEGASRSLFTSVETEALTEIHRESRRFSHDARLVVSEPLTELSGAWVEVEESTVVEVAGGEVKTRPFRPQPPA